MLYTPPTKSCTFLGYTNLQITVLPGGPSSSEGSTVGPMVLSLAIFNNLVLTMSSQIGKTLTKRRTQKLENLHYFVLSTLFPLPVHLDDQCGEFLKSWMAYLEFDEFPDLIEYYTTIGNSTLLKEKYTTIKECTLPKDIDHFMYLTQSYFLDDTPNQILHIMSTLLYGRKLSTLLLVSILPI